MPEEHAAEQPLKGASGIEPLFTFPHPVNEYGSRSIAGLSFFTATATATATAIIATAIVTARRTARYLPL